jgi:ribosomal protein S18 acetylase RimI-like enzyme
MALTIRPATLADLSRLHPVIERTYRGTEALQGWTNETRLNIPGARTDLATLAGLVTDPASRLLIALEGDAPIGCVNIADKGDGLAYLGLLCVDPVLQAAGLGKRLLAAAEDAARAEFGATAIEMTVIDSRAELIAWYQRRGYRVSGETRDFPVAMDPPLTMTVLVKQLN